MIDTMRGKLALLTVALMVLCAAVIGNVTAQTDNTSDDKLIYASGTGKVTTTPDRVIISLAVETQHTDVKVAQSDNARLMEKVTGAIKAAGISEDDLKTTGYSIYPVYDSSGSQFTRDIKSYRVTNTLMITLKDINRAGEIIDIGIANGANRVDGVTFTLSDEKQQELRADALTAAVAQARGDANAVAAALGKTIIDVKEVNIGSSYVPMRYAEYDMVSSAGAAKVATPIQAGDVDVTATVSITYIIR